MCAPYRVVRTGPVCCEPRHRRVEASSVGLCRRWRRTFWTKCHVFMVHCVYHSNCYSAYAIVIIYVVVLLISQSAVNCFLTFRFVTELLRIWQAIVAIFKVFWSLLSVKVLKLGPKVATWSTPPDTHADNACQCCWYDQVRFLPACSVSCLYVNGGLNLMAKLSRNRATSCESQLQWAHSQLQLFKQLIN